MKYRRIEVNAYRRRVTIVSGERRKRDVLDAQPAETDDDVSLTDSDSCESVAQDSLEGQMILVDAVRSLQRRLSPEARATLCAREDKFVPNRSTFKRFYHKLRCFFQPKDPDLFRQRQFCGEAVGQRLIPPASTVDAGSLPTVASRNKKEK